MEGTVNSKGFDVAMYKKITEDGMTYVQAYNALGFDTKILGENRANAAGKRVILDEMISKWRQMEHSSCATIDKKSKQSIINS